MVDTNLLFCLEVIKGVGTHNDLPHDDSKRVHVACGSDDSVVLLGCGVGEELWSRPPECSGTCTVLALTWRQEPLITMVTSQSLHSVLELQLTICLFLHFTLGHAVKATTHSKMQPHYMFVTTTYVSAFYLPNNYLQLRKVT